MRILILGTNYAAVRFLDVFQKNPQNDVFSMLSHSKNRIDFVENTDIVEFCCANDINLVLATEEKYTISYLTEELSESNITVFAPAREAIELTHSKVFAKRFMHKNQIPTPKFFVAEKIQPAIDFIKSSHFPVALKPDNHSFQETTLFCQTQKEAHSMIENFFNTGNKRIVLEDYVEGKNISVWTISDGYQAKIIAMNFKYQNNISYFKPNLISEELQTKIQENIIKPTLDALVAEKREYVGVLGFDIIIDKAQNPYLVNYNSFFDDMSVDYFAKNENYNFEEIFVDTIVGNIFLNDILPENSDYMLIMRKNEKINSIKAKTKSNLYMLLDEMDYDRKELDEARKIWKM